MMLAGQNMSGTTMSVPFFLAGATKIVYDLWLYVAFTRTSKPNESHS